MRGFDDFSGWFAKCCDMYEFSIEEDALATTFLSSGAVLLLMGALETGSARVISSISGLPEEFTAGVLKCADRAGFRNSEWFKNLELTIRQDPRDLADIWLSLQSGLERFWLEADEKWTGGLLHELRGRALVGGQRQTWVDKEELEEFLSELSETEFSRDS
jgi:hypothetical protein